MKIILTTLTIVVALFLQTLTPSLWPAWLAETDFFVIAIVFLACALPVDTAIVACAASGLAADAFTSTPFGLQILANLLALAVILRVRKYLVPESFSCRFTSLFLAIWANAVGVWLALELVCGMDAAFHPGQVLPRALATTAVGMAVFAALGRRTTRWRTRLAAF